MVLSSVFASCDVLPDIFAIKTNQSFRGVLCSFNAIMLCFECFVKFALFCSIVEGTHSDLCLRHYFLISLSVYFTGV